MTGCISESLWGVLQRCEESDCRFLAAHYAEGFIDDARVADRGPRDILRDVRLCAIGDLSQRDLEKTERKAWRIWEDPPRGIDHTPMCQTPKEMALAAVAISAGRHTRYSTYGIVSRWALAFPSRSRSIWETALRDAQRVQGKDP